MDTQVDRPAFIVSLLNEVDACDDAAFAPQSEASGEDEFIGEIPAGWLRKVYALALYYNREFDRISADWKYDRKNQEFASGASEAKDKHDVLIEIFWACAKDHFRLWGCGRCLGIRDGWKLVYTAHDGHEVSDFLKGLFGK